MKVRIRDASFSGVYPHVDMGLPQVAFAGRSNVGKSSLINALLNRKNLVHTSKKPGKTRTVNFYRVESVELAPLYLVDLPGYGYAEAPKTVIEAWRQAISSYLAGAAALRLLVLLVDIRRDIGDHERLLIQLASKTKAELLVAATKGDKLGHGQRTLRVAELSRQAQAGVVLTSAHDRTGVDDLWDHIASAVRQEGRPR